MSEPMITVVISYLQTFLYTNRDLGSYTYHWSTRSLVQSRQLLPLLYLTSRAVRITFGCAQ